MKSDHQMIVEMHSAIINDMATTTDLNRAKREIIKSYSTNRKSVAELPGPINAVRRSQVEKVRRLLYEAYQEGRTMSLNEACIKAWEPLTGGYPTPKALYEYCHAHEDIF